ncbi:hypothetical protein ACIRUY_25895 [Streptomyces erythrochromogenes]|uniref:hypothetical protein n=1 Tax=Streptomyces erythrochromogenes TaxID=285574 RepID=UPI0038052F95
MNWGALISTLVGAVIGVGSTLLADRVRWRRELEQRGKDSRRELYGQFLTALNEAAESLWVVGLGDRRAAGIERLDELLRAEVHRTGLYSLREQVMILATEDVRRVADQAVDRVREYRDCLISGSAGGSPEERTAMDAYKSTIKVLREAMRADMAD